MSDEYSNVFQNQEEDVILEGSDLHQALTNMGYNNFESIPRVKMEFISSDTDQMTTKNNQSLYQILNEKLNLIYEHIFQENILRREQLKIISEANVLLDDHAATINEFLENKSTLKYRKYFEWLPVISSTITATLILKTKNIPTIISTITALGFYAFKKVEFQRIINNLKHLVTVQNELHDLCKQGLRILRRTYGRKSIVTEVYEKNELLGSKKQRIVILLKQLMIEIFENLSFIYYKQADEILNILPSTLHTNCILTKINSENFSENDKNYDEIKSLYYTFILVQSEMMFIMANACNVKSRDICSRISKVKLSKIINDLTKSLTANFSKLTEIMQIYQLSEIQPIQRVFRGIPNSKWQDTYIHLDLTSQKIQLAYKEIVSILETIDINSEKNEDDLQLVESITDKVNEAYKHIENARSFAEFSSLLIAKAQRKPINTTEGEKENENITPVNDKKIIMIDEEPEIEDEVFEEYIKEEYLKPLYESNEGTIENYKLDKLLKKHFMSELKEALIEKQKSMTERELKALKRMYNRVRRDSCINKSEPVLGDIKTEKSITLPPPPPPPPLPPPILKNTIIAETKEEEDDEDHKAARTPVPLPRFKMLQPDEEMPYIPQFSITECTPNFRFPLFKGVEETFLGSGENSEEEEESSKNCSDDNEDIIEN